MPGQPFFQVPSVEDNEDGWGPTTVPQQLEGIPYAPFSKGDKVSKISDFTGSGFNRYGGECRQTTADLSHLIHQQACDLTRLLQAEEGVIKGKALLSSTSFTMTRYPVSFMLHQSMLLLC